MDHISGTVAANTLDVRLWNRMWSAIRDCIFYVTSVFGARKRTTLLEVNQLDADASDTPAVRTDSGSMDAWLKALLDIPQFPETEDDARNLLSFVRSQREECELRKNAMEAAVHQCILQLQICQQKPSTQLITQRLVDLDIRRKALAQATEVLLQAERRIGAVRALLRRKGLPLIFGRNDTFRRVSSSSTQYVGDSDDAYSRASSLSDQEGEEEEETV